MASTLFTIAGVFCLVVVTLDFIVVTVGASATRMPSRWVARMAFLGLRPLFRLLGPWLHRVSGPLAMSSIAAWWILSISVGWTMLFQAADLSIVDSDTGAPVPRIEDYAYIGHMLSTLGGSLAKPGSAFWAVISVFVAVNGMVVLTLSVSFILSTTQTVTQGRALMAKAELMEAARAPVDTALLRELASLLAALNSSPFALYYSDENPRRRFPEGLVMLAEWIKREDASHFAAFRTLLSDLPEFRDRDGMSDDEVIAALRDWARNYKAEPDEDSASLATG